MANNKHKVGAAHQLVNDYFYKNTFENFDFMGLNYYFKNPVSYKYYFKKVREFDYEKIIRDEGRSLGWDMNPSGLYDCIKYLKVKFDKPIYILEHGISDPDDKKRSKYIKEALSSVARAIKDGADVRGYLHWTLVDNFEWNLGYISKFGMFALDPKTLKRIPKKSAYFFRDICLKNQV